MLSKNIEQWKLAHQPQQFASTVSHACDSMHFLNSDFLATANLLNEPFQWHRKLWEFVTIAEIGKKAINISGSSEGTAAIGFGVGREPLTSFFASIGYDVLATDQPIDTGITASEWSGTDQLASNELDSWKSKILDIEKFKSRVKFRAVDMNEIPDDLQPCHLMWSSCVIEHLGSLENAIEFLRKSSRLLLPGGTMVHTTEIELTEKQKMEDYGHCAVFRPQDIVQLISALNAEGLDSQFSFYIPMETYQDKYISIPPYESDKPHLKLALFNSITTSFAIVASRPLGEKSVL
jgi:hypothetical protein